MSDKDWYDNTVRYKVSENLDVNSDFVHLLSTFEGVRKNAYLDPVGIPTIGIGFTEGVKMGDTMTMDEIKFRLYKEVDRFEEAVNDLVTVPLTGYQFNALVSLTYNIGIGGFKESTVLKKTNLKNYNQASDAFMLWNKARKNGKLVVLPGLNRRRGAESAMFNGQDWREFL